MRINFIAHDHHGSLAPAGWYSDPFRPGALRWWDGTRWTAQAMTTEPASPRQGAATRREDARLLDDADLLRRWDDLR